MTDAVSKNLKIENNIADHFHSNHKPYHLLCKSHTVEKLDTLNLSVLSKVEASVNQRSILESISPSLKSFFHGTKTTVESGIVALLTLVSHNKSGKSSSLADLFDHICEKEGTVKEFFFISSEDSLSWINLQRHYLKPFQFSILKSIENY